MRYKSSSELKDIAREQLRGKYGVVIGAVLLTSLISLTITFFVERFFKLDSITSIITYILVTFIVSLLMAVLSLGLLKFIMNLCRNEKYAISDLFWGFKNHADKIILTTILLLLIFIACYVPTFVFVIIYEVSGSILMYILTMLAVIAGTIALIIVSLMYGLTSYIIADGTEDSVIQIMRESRLMMQGHKARLFYLNITFIGWYLLSILSCGLALLWIEPYRMCAVTYFYMDLKGEFNNKVIEQQIEADKQYI